MTGADSRRPSGLKDPCKGLDFDHKRSGHSLQFEESRGVLWPECSSDHSGVYIGERRAPGQRQRAPLGASVATQVAGPGWCSAHGERWLDLTVV